VNAGPSFAASSLCIIYVLRSRWFLVSASRGASIRWCTRHIVCWRPPISTCGLACVMMMTKKKADSAAVREDWPYSCHNRSSCSVYPAARMRFNRLTRSNWHRAEEWRRDEWIWFSQCSRSYLNPNHVAVAQKGRSNKNHPILWRMWCKIFQC